MKCFRNFLDILLKLVLKSFGIPLKHPQDTLEISSNNLKMLMTHLQGVPKKMDLLYLLNISGTKKQISKPFFPSEN